MFPARSALRVTQLQRRTNALSKSGKSPLTPERPLTRKKEGSLTTPKNANLEEAPSQALSAVTGSNRRTLDAIFRHPLAHNLGWNDVVALLEKIGEVEEK